jgi:hypothetical protein
MHDTVIQLRFDVLQARPEATTMQAALDCPLRFLSFYLPRFLP